MLDNSSWLASKLQKGSNSMVKHRTNAINYLFKIYKDCESKFNKELDTALYYKVPQSKIRSIVEDSTSTDGYTAMNIIKRAKSKRSMIKELSVVIASDVDVDDIKELVNDIDLGETTIRLKGKTLKDLWKMLPTGKDSMKSLNYRSLLNIFGIEGQIRPIRVNGESHKGVEVRR